MTPEPDDYTLTPTGPLGSKIAVSYEGKHLGDFGSLEIALEAVEANMQKEGVFPGMWWISDHGNMWPIDIHGNEISMEEEIEEEPVADEYKILPSEDRHILKSPESCRKAYMEYRENYGAKSVVDFVQGWNAAIKYMEENNGQ